MLSKQQVTVHGHITASYGPTPSLSTLICPGQYIELNLSSTINPDTILAIEPRIDCSKSTGEWPTPNIIQAVAVKIHILNESPQPLHLPCHDHCQALHTYVPNSVESNTASVTRTPVALCTLTPPTYTSLIHLDPDHILPEDIRTEFVQLVKQFDAVLTD